MERNLTKGSIFKNLILFSLPYLLSCFLQSFYGLADLFITGDVKHHEALDSIMDGINVLDANHYSEYVMKDGLKSLLEDWTNGEINVVSSNINTDPYEYM